LTDLLALTLLGVASLLAPFLLAVGSDPGPIAAVAPALVAGLLGTAALKGIRETREESLAERDRILAEASAHDWAEIHASGGPDALADRLRRRIWRSPKGFLIGVSAAGSAALAYFAGVLVLG